MRDRPTRRWLALAPLVALLPLLALLVPSAAGRAQDGGGEAAPFGESPKLGVVDIGEIFGKYVRAKRLETRINEEKLALEKEMEKQRDLIIKLRKEGEFYTGERAEDAEVELQIEVGRLRLMKQRAERTLKRRFEDYTTKILKEIEEVVREYGTRHRYTLILKVDSKRWGEDRLQAALQSVLFHSEQVDLTKTVVTVLNGEGHLKQMAARDAKEEAPPGD